jgi:hypothetical protein
MPRVLPFAALLPLTLWSSLALADYVAPSGGGEDPNDPEVEPEATPKPGKRKFYVVEVEEVERPKRNVGITFDPLSLLYPIFQMHVDVRLSDDFGIGVIGGYGKAKVDYIAIGNEAAPPPTPLWQIGAKAMYYAQGDFEGGLHVGVEALYTHAKLEGRTALGTGSIGGLAAGLTVGPFIGWKLVTRAGFTFDSAIGVGMIASKQKSSDPDAPTDDRSAVLISHLLIGWTF